MNFRTYVEKTWDGEDFCNLLALNARGKILKIMSEMALGAQNISKMPVMLDKSVWKFLQQFPTEAWVNAMHWLYTHAITDLMKTPGRERGEIPKENNWTDVIEIPNPNRSNTKTWVFGTPGKKGMWTGLSDLVLKLSKPVKTGNMRAEDLPPVSRRYWAGDEHPNIEDVPPNESDKYKHGTHDYDFEDMAEATPEDIESKSDEEVQQLLPEKFRNMKLDDPELQKRIKKKREDAKKVLKTSFAGYDVLQKDIATRAITNWIRANGLPERPYGPHPGEQGTSAEQLDPVTGQPYLDASGKPQTVRHITPSEIKGMHGRWRLTYGHGEKEKPVDIPAVQKTFNFQEKDNKTGNIKPETETNWVPILNNSKGMPVVRLSDEQKAKLDKRKGKRGKKEAEEDDEAEGERAVQSFGGLKNMLNHWDMLDDKQKEFVIKNTKNEFEIAKATHAKNNNPNLDVDERARIHNLYTAGFNPNYKTAQRPMLNFDSPEKVDKFLNKYKGEIAGEVFTTVDNLLKSYEKNKNVNAQVVKALRAVEADVSEIITYSVLLWLNNDGFGIKDPEIGLLNNLKEDEYDEAKNKENRNVLVWKELMKIMQFSFVGVPSRRLRKQGISGEHSYDAPQGEEGTSMAGQLSGGGGKRKEISSDAKRFALNTQTGSLVASSHKAPSFFKLDAWMNTNRSKILNKMQNNSSVAQDLKKADDNVATALQISFDLYNRYYNELSKSITDPDKLDDEAQKMTDASLANEIKKHLGGLPTRDMEELLAQVKNVTYSSMSKTVSNETKEEAKKEILSFLNKLTVDDEPAALPMFDSSTNTFHDTNNRISRNMFKTTYDVIRMLKELVPDQFFALKDEVLKKQGPELWASIVLDKNPRANEEEAKQEYNAALAKQTPMGQQQPVSSQPSVAPQVHHPIGMAAKSINDLLTTASNFNTKAEMEQIINDVISKRDELIRNPEEASKLGGIANAIRNRSAVINATDPLQPQDYGLIHKLSKFIREIGEALKLQKK